RGDFFADFQVRLLFFVERGGDDLHHLLADGVAVFNKFYIVAGYQHVRDLMGDSDNLFAAQSHSGRLPSSLSFPGGRQPARQMMKPSFSNSACSLPQNQLAIARELLLHLLVHLLVRDAGAPHLILMLEEDIAHLFVEPVLDGDLFHHALPETLRNRVRSLRLNQLPFHKPLDHFRGHVSDVISCNQHPRVSPLRESKRKSLLAVPTKCKEERNSSFGGARVCPQVLLTDFVAQAIL